MPADFIKINSTDSNAILARDVKQAVENVRSAYTQLCKVVSILQHNFTSGQSIDWSQVESICGLPAGQGSTVFTLLDGSRGVMNGEFQNNNAVELISRVG